VLDRSTWSTSCPTCFTHWKEHRYALNRELGGPYSLAGCFEEEKMGVVLLCASAMHLSQSVAMWEASVVFVENRI